MVGLTFGQVHPATDRQRPICEVGMSGSVDRGDRGRGRAAICDRSGSWRSGRSAVDRGRAAIDRGHDDRGQVGSFGMRH